jgi:uncharacterized membrane protein YraQ (UPF0718 family)
MGDALTILAGGVGNLAAYLAAHVLLCLLPAFLMAGAMAALIPQTSITRWLGRSAPAHVSYPAAVAAGSVLAVCSCTIVPLFAGIYRKGAGIGPAITFLFFAPAGNIMALAYTGSILGAEFAVGRLVLCLVFGIGIGLVMASFFWRDDAGRHTQAADPFAAAARLGAAAAGLLGSLFMLLIAGTLQLWPLTAALFSIDVPLSWAQDWQATLLQWVPFDAAKGEEGVTVQGSMLIVLLLLIGVAAWRGLEDIVEGPNRWTWVALCLAAVTLMAGSLRLIPSATGLHIGLTGRAVAVALALTAVWEFGRRLDVDDWCAWLWESWRFGKQIFPLLVIGVFVVGVARQLIRPEWIQAWAGSNTLGANAVAVGFGVFMYFPTLVEVPVARMFLDLGMHPGPLLAYLMADPELSLQSMLMVAAVIGRLKTAAYVALVAVFSVVAGTMYGAWTDGASRMVLALVLFGIVAVLAGVMAWLKRGQTTSAMA